MQGTCFPVKRKRGHLRISYIKGAQKVSIPLKELKVWAQNGFTLSQGGVPKSLGSTIFPFCSPAPIHWDPRYSFLAVSYYLSFLIIILFMTYLQVLRHISCLYFILQEDGIVFVKLFGFPPNICYYTIKKKHIYPTLNSLAKDRLR